DGRPGPGGALDGPADAVVVDEPRPVGAVRVAQVLHLAEDTQRRVTTADRRQGQHELAGLATGDPGILGHAAGAETGDDELVPPRVDALRRGVAGDRSPEHGVVPVHGM